jgi:hypothetical protein
MTNLIDDTETTGKRLFEPFALALLAAGGMSASVARSDGGSEEAGLIVPPITAQAHAAESPAPEAATSSAPAALSVQASGGAASETQALASGPATTNPPLSSTAPIPNRFAEVFAEPGVAPASLALERPQPEVEAALKASADAGLAAQVEARAPMAAAQLVPETIEPALQLVAAEPVPAKLPVSAAALAVMNLPAPALVINPGPGIELAPLAAPTAIAAEPIQLAVAPVVAGVEAASLATETRLESVTPAPMAEPLPAPAAPANAEPAALVPPPAAAVAAPGPVALALAEPGTESPKRAFVSEPVVQSVPAAAALKPIALAIVPPSVTAIRQTTAPAPRLAKVKPPRGTQIGGTIASNFQLTDGTIDYRIGARVNGGEPASLPLRISRDDQLSVKLGDLLALVRPQMDPALYACLAAARGADEYVTFAAIRSSGIDIRYDAARDQLLLGVE